MTRTTPTAFVAVAASLMCLCSAISGGVVAAPRASAGPPSVSAAEVPLVSRLRACDFTPLTYVDARGDARAIAHVASTGTGTLVAAVDVATALPFTRYDIRVIQTPRPSIGCGPGAGGVIVGSVQTDALGAGTTTLQGPIASGATGAWVIVERPAEYTQTPAEFYTSTFIATI